jgi:uncharacterized protein
MENDKSDSGADMITVEVVYALPEQQQLIALQVPVGTTALGAVRLSGIAGLFAGIDIEQTPMGIFGKSVDAASHVLAAGERVEIYRPLLIDPKESRKARAAKVKAGKAVEKLVGAKSE